MTADEIQQKNLELELVLTLDQVRDAYDDDEDPGAMFDSITQLLKERFQADACAILLLTAQSDVIQHISYRGVDEDIAIELGKQAMQLADFGAVEHLKWSHTYAAPIKLKGELLGSVWVARNNAAFTASEQLLFRLAESQIDSAVIQARTIWKFMQRNRELEAIHEIDRLRDYTSSESDLISGFTSVLLKHFDAELCMIILSHAENGELTVRGIIDKIDLPASTIELIYQAASKVKKAQELATPSEADKLSLMAAPLLISGVHLGTLVVGSDTLFKVNDLSLLTTMSTQMDSALVYSRTQQQLNQRTRELEIIYRIDGIRDQEKDFDGMLQKVLQELCSVISGETGYIMLYDENEKEQLQLKAATIDNLSNAIPSYGLIRQYSRQALDTGKLVYDNLSNEHIRSIIAIPLILNDRIIGVFGAINSTSARGFSSEDRRLLTAITSQVDTAIFERLEQRRMRTLLSRSVDAKVLDRLLAQTNAARLLTGERVVLSALFADLRNSTEWTESTEPEELVSSLNLFLGKMTDVIFKYGGTLDKFVGDQVIGLFGTPLPLADHAHYAAQAALEMQTVHAALQQELQAQGLTIPPMGIGICSGEVIAGEFGPPIRTDFTAMGNVMNLSARLCGVAKAGQILISQSTRDLLPANSETEQQSSIELKGIRQPQTIYTLRKFML